ncbi:MAG: efflux RND transporter periplasmic adaptor subunit [Myxococcota bacterium]
MPPLLPSSRPIDPGHATACAARPRIVGLVVCLALVAAACSSPTESTPVTTAAAEQRDIERIVMATGTIEPAGEVEVRPRVAGIIEAINVERGDTIEAGDALVEIERELLESQVARARAQVKSAEVELHYAEIAKQRAERLRARGAASDSQQDEARADLEGASARLASARASLQELSVQLRYATVRSPISGRVLDVHVKVGAAVSPVTSVNGGTVLLVLAETERLHMTGSVDENEISRIAVGQSARVRTEAYRGRSFEGTVRDIAPMGERVENVTYFEIEVEITDADADLLKARMSADAEIVAESIDAAIVVPETALRYVGEDIYVEIVGDDASVNEDERRFVSVGVVDGDLVQIVDGLAIGERVSLQ